MKKDERKKSYIIKISEDFNVSIREATAMYDTMISTHNKKIEEENKYPKHGSFYYNINTYGELCHDMWANTLEDKEKLAIGNYFKTDDDAQFQIERLKVIKELKRYAESKDSIWDCVTGHWFIYYDFAQNRINYYEHLTVKNSELYFETKEDAISAVQHVGRDRVKKYYLGVEG